MWTSSPAPFRAGKGIPGRTFTPYRAILRSDSIRVPDLLVYVTSSPRDGWVSAAAVVAWKLLSVRVDWLVGLDQCDECEGSGFVVYGPFPVPICLSCCGTGVYAPGAGKPSMPPHTLSFRCGHCGDLMGSPMDAASLHQCAAAIDLLR